MNRLGGKYVLLDPDEPMVGTCTVCKTTIRTERRKTFKDKKSPANASLGAWAEMPYVECQVCKDRAAELIKRVGVDRKPIGTKVYVGVETKRANDEQTGNR